jgi:hypothetical protein
MGLNVERKKWLNLNNKTKMYIIISIVPVHTLQYSRMNVTGHRDMSGKQIENNGL